MKLFILMSWKRRCLQYIRNQFFKNKTKVWYCQRQRQRQKKTKTKTTHLENEEKLKTHWKTHKKPMMMVMNRKIQKTKQKIQFQKKRNKNQSDFFSFFLARKHYNIKKVNEWRNKQDNMVSFIFEDIFSSTNYCTLCGRCVCVCVR